MKLTQKLRVFAKHHFTDHPHDGPAEEAILNNIEKLGFDLESHYLFLSKLSSKFTMSVLRTAEYEGKGYPIHCIDFQPEATGQRLFVLAGSHGNEEAGLLAVEEYIKFLDTLTVGEKDVAVRIVTPHNPVGTAMFSRYNGQGYDMNRDFAKKNTIETRAVTESFEQFNPTLAISLHEGPQTAGAFFFTNKHVKKELISPVLNELIKNDVGLASKSYFGNKLGVPGQFPSKGFFLVLTKLWRFFFKFQGFGSYCADQKVPALVMETSWSTTKSTQRVDAQLIALKVLTTH